MSAATKEAARIRAGDSRRARKTCLVTVRFAPDEYEDLVREANAEGENVSELVRRKCVGGR